MKCIQCNGSGLKDQNNICPACNGFGVVAGAEPVVVAEARIKKGKKK